MATKAELEAELAKLRSELSDLKSTPRAAADDVGDEVADADSEPKDASVEDHKAVVEALQEGDLESIVQALMDELEDLPSRKPLLTALGAFIVGYLIGRTGSKG